MSFQPIIPSSGYTGWSFLQRTMHSQQAAFAESAPVRRATEDFRERIATIQNPEELVADRRLLSVALGAFGLDADIDSQFFIKKVLQEGTADDTALASRLSDPRYAMLADSFGFAQTDGPNTADPSFAEEILSRYEARQFERAVGERDDTMRLALNLSSGLQELVDRGGSDDTQWFSIMGNLPLRGVFETAFGFPASYGRIDLDLDLQLDGFKDRANSIFGTTSPADFVQPEVQEKLIRLFLTRSEMNESGSLSGSSVALQLLQQR